MYNEEVKSKFITEMTSSLSRRNTAKNFFDGLGEYEEKWGADACTVPREDLIKAMNHLVGLRDRTKSIYVVFIRNYIKWCVENHVEGASGDLIRLSDIDGNAIYKKTVTNPKHLQRYLDCLCDPESENSLDCLFRCYYWLAYAGVTQEVSFEILDSDVDLDNMVIRHNGEEYEIYQESIPAIRRCVALTKFVNKNKRYGSRYITIPRIDGHLLLRGRFDPKQRWFSMRAVYLKDERKYFPKEDNIDPALDLDLTYYSVWLSGLFYRMNEAEKAGLPVDFKPLAQKTYKGNRRRACNEKAVQYEIDYERWKDRVYS